MCVRDCLVWNLATMEKYVWQVSPKVDLLWIKWIHCVYVKEQAWWEYNAPSITSWGWKIICKAKDKFKLAYT